MARIPARCRGDAQARPHHGGSVWSLTRSQFRRKRTCGTQSKGGRALAYVFTPRIPDGPRCVGGRRSATTSSGMAAGLRRRFDYAEASPARGGDACLEISHGPCIPLKLAGSAQLGLSAGYVRALPVNRAYPRAVFDGRRWMFPTVHKSSRRRAGLFVRWSSRLGRGCVGRRKSMRECAAWRQPWPRLPALGPESGVDGADCGWWRISE